MVLMKARAVAWVAVVGSLGCASDHHVSPWPRGVTIRTLMRPSSVETHLARMDDEMRAEGLRLDDEVAGDLRGGEPFRIRSYRGTDELGNMRTALRVATRYGVVMALGPTSPGEALRGRQVSFVPAMGEAGTWRSGTDLNGDGLPDVLVERSGGTLEIWGLHAKGASPYPIEGVAPATAAVDIDEDGRPELMGRVAVPPHDPVSPRLTEILAFRNGRYTADAHTVVAYHRRELASAGGDTARERIERAWHRLRAGKDLEAVLGPLEDFAHDDTQSSAERVAVERWRTFFLRSFGSRTISTPGRL